MKLRPGPAVASAIVLAVALSACATKPKYAPSTPAPVGSQRQPAPRGAPSPAVSSSSVAPLPGSERDFVVNAGDRVYFDFDQFAVRSDAVPILDAQAAWLRLYPAVMVRIEGNADERGTREYNFALGARRAAAIRDFLVARGVNPARISTISYGKERPIDPSSGEDAWAHNRNGHTAIVAGAR